jgi:hypothetical protein
MAALFGARPILRSVAPVLDEAVDITRYSAEAVERFRKVRRNLSRVQGTRKDRDVRRQ